MKACHARQIREGIEGARIFWNYTSRKWRKAVDWWDTGTLHDKAALQTFRKLYRKNR